MRGDWNVTGRAQGRNCYVSWNLLRKERGKIPGRKGKNYETACFISAKHEYILPRFPNDLVPSEDRIIVTPKSVSSKLGDNDDGKGNTICNVYINKTFFSTALYNQEKKEIRIAENI